MSKRRKESSVSKRRQRPATEPLSLPKRRHADAIRHLSKTSLSSKSAVTPKRQSYLLRKPVKGRNVSARFNVFVKCKRRHLTGKLRWMQSRREKCRSNMSLSSGLQNKLPKTKNQGS